MNTIMDMFLNNTMDVQFFDDLKTGSTLVLHEKQPNNHVLEFCEPFEITVETTKKHDVVSDYDHNEIEEALMITDTDGDQYLVEYSMMIPIMDKYEVYPNWNVYYSMMQEDVNLKTQKLKLLTKFIDDYTVFKSEMYSENPEKLI